jgi:hypothetical protein
MEKHLESTTKETEVLKKEIKLKYGSDVMQL